MKTRLGIPLCCAASLAISATPPLVAQSVFPPPAFAGNVERLTTFPDAAITVTNSGRELQRLTLLPGPPAVAVNGAADYVPLFPLTAKPLLTAVSVPGSFSFSKSARPEKPRTYLPPNYGTLTLKPAAPWGGTDTSSAPGSSDFQFKSNAEERPAPAPTSPRPPLSPSNARVR